MNTHRILERVGLRPTFPRVLVLEFFQAHAHEHLGAEADPEIAVRFAFAWLPSSRQN